MTFTQAAMRLAVTVCYTPDAGKLPQTIILA